MAFPWVFLERLVIGGASQGLLVAFERDDAVAEGGAFQFLGVFAYLVEHLRPVLRVQLLPEVFVVLAGLLLGGREVCACGLACRVGAGAVLAAGVERHFS